LTSRSASPSITNEVFGELSRCGFGAYAEFAAAPEQALALKPANLSFEEAATLPTAGCTALQGLRKGRIQRAQRILINGASGGVGTFAVQIAKSFGTDVTAVCSTRNLDMVRSIGADHVIDYTKDDFATQGQRYDLILATNGDRSIWDYRRALTADGCYAMTGGSNRQLTEALLFGPLLSIGRQQFGNVLVKPNQGDLLVLKELCESGKVRPVIDRRFPLSEVASAVRGADQNTVLDGIAEALLTYQLPAGERFSVHDGCVHLVRPGACEHRAFACVKMWIVLEHAHSRFGCVET
jgi:NADPH:quinone reductase-like Zn-dependent oxidoreductase